MQNKLQVHWTRIEFPGAATVLRAAVIAGKRLTALICLDGLPDLAREVLPSIQIHALFIGTSSDERIKSINNYSYSLLQCGKQIKIIEEHKQHGNDVETLKKVADLSYRWLLKKNRPPHESRKRISFTLKSDGKNKIKKEVAQNKKWNLIHPNKLIVTKSIGAINLWQNIANLVYLKICRD